MIEHRSTIPTIKTQRNVEDDGNVGRLAAADCGRIRVRERTNRERRAKEQGGRGGV